MSTSKQVITQMYKYMVLSRRFEETIEHLYANGEKTSMTPYLGIGEEAVSVGICLALGEEDIISPHFRGSSARLAKGLPASELMARWFGRRVGLPIQPNHDFNILWQSSSSLGPSLDIAVGAALAVKLKQTGQVVVSTFGDGESNRGNFHESLNFAAVFKLPIVFVCRNNRYAMSMPVSKGVGTNDIADRAIGYGFPGVVVDGNDVMLVYEAVQKASQRARKGLGPTLIEAKTYRLSPHSQHDEDQYRPEGEYEKYEKQDPLKKIETHLKKRGVPGKELDDINEWAEAEVKKAVKLAKEEPWMSPETLLGKLKEIYEDIYDISLP